MNIFGGLGLGGQAVNVQLEYKGRNQPITTATVKTKLSAETETLPLYTNKDSVCGDVVIVPVGGKKVDHQGVKVQLIGEIELASEKGHPSEFVCLNRLLAPAGDIAQQVSDHVYDPGRAEAMDMTPICQ